MKQGQEPTRTLVRQETAAKYAAVIRAVAQTMRAEECKDIQTAFVEGCNKAAPQAGVTAESVDETLAEAVSFFDGVRDGFITVGTPDLDANLRMLQRGAAQVCQAFPGHEKIPAFNEMKQVLPWSLRAGLTVRGQALQQEGLGLTATQRLAAERSQKIAPGFGRS